MTGRPAQERARERANRIERRATDIYGSARSDWLLGFCQSVVSLCAEHRLLSDERDAAVRDADTLAEALRDEHAPIKSCEDRIAGELLCQTCRALEHHDALLASRAAGEQAT